MNVRLSLVLALLSWASVFAQAWLFLLNLIVPSRFNLAIFSFFLVTAILSTLTYAPKSR
jgi:hypothetical protein